MKITFPTFPKKLAINQGSLLKSTKSDLQTANVYRA